MKKLQRLSLTHLANETVVLTPQEQMGIYAGSGIDGLCVYEAMGIANSGLGGSSDYNDYIADYASSNGWSSVYGVSVDSSGESQIYFKGLDTSDAVQFIQSEFDATSIGINDYQSVLSQGHEIITDMYQGNGVSHAVVVYDYDENMGMYKYKDENGLLHEASADKFNTSMSLSINGLK